MTLEERQVLKSEYKTIAEFLGYEYFPYSNTKGIQEKEYPGWFKPMCLPSLKHGENLFRLYMYKSPCFICRKTIDLDFDRDWGRLMSAVEKIESIRDQRYGRFIVSISEDGCAIQSTNKTKETNYSKSYIVKDNKKRAVYQSVLLFIEWYNKNLK